MDLPNEPEQPQSQTIVKTDHDQDKEDEKILGMESKTFHTVKWVVIISLIFVGIVALLAWNSNRHKKYSNETLERITKLVQISAKSAEDAERLAESNPLQALHYAQYAACYINAAKLLTDNDELLLNRLTGSNMEELQLYLTSLQSRLNSRLVQKNKR